MLRVDENLNFLVREFERGEQADRTRENQKDSESEEALRRSNGLGGILSHHRIMAGAPAPQPTQ